jgi:hypothetical protein
MLNFDPHTQFLLGLYFGVGFAYAMKWWEIYEFHFTEEEYKRFHRLSTPENTFIAQAALWPGYVLFMVVIVAIDRFNKEDPR